MVQSSEIENISVNEHSSPFGRTILIDGEPAEVDCDALQALIPDLIKKDRNEQRRLVAHMWFVLELNAAEISAKTGLSQGTIRSHVSRFRQALKEAAIQLIKSQLQ